MHIKQNYRAFSKKVKCEKVALRNEYKWGEVAQSCPTLQPHGQYLPGSFVHGFSQARILEWIAISFSRRSSPPRDWTRVSRIVGRHFTVWATREVQGMNTKGRVFLPWVSRSPLVLSNWCSPLPWTTQIGQIDTAGLMVFCLPSDQV